MKGSIGHLQPHEVPALCELFQRVFSVTLTPEARHWKYEQGPRLGSLSLVARDGAGALVGHVGALVFPGVCQGRALPMAQVCDIMVDSRARGGLDAGGVYGRLMQALQAELSHTHPDVLAYGFAGIRPYRLGERMGLYRSGQPCRLGLLEDVVEVSAAKLPGAHSAAGSVAWPWRLTARRTSWAHPALGRLWTQLGVPSPTPLVARTPAYLHWRYATHPSCRYQPWLLQRWARPVGWVFTRVLPNGTVCLVDQLLPAGVSPAQAAAAVLAQGAGAPAPNPSVGSWWMHTEASARLEPIIGGEVVVDARQGPGLLPRFQPGDTDVF
jgi:hypothetical protein